MNVRMTEHHMKVTDVADVALRQEHIEKTCEVMQAMIAERGDDQFSNEGMKMFGGEGRKTPMS